MFTAGMTACTVRGVVSLIDKWMATQAVVAANYLLALTSADRSLDDDVNETLLIIMKQRASPEATS